MYDIHWTVQDRDVLKAVDELIFLMSDIGLTAFLGASIGPYLSQRAKQRFASEGDDVTGPWAPLKPATITIRQSQNYGSGPINRRTGELENWVVGSGWDAYPTGMGASMRFPGKPPTGELKAKVQTAQGGRVNPPTVARPVLGLNENDLLFLQTAFAMAVDEALE